MVSVAIVFYSPSSLRSKNFVSFRSQHTDSFFTMSIIVAAAATSAAYATTNS